MKKIVFTLCVCLAMLSPSIAKAQNQDQTGLFSVAGNLNYGSKIESIGIGMRMQYGFTDRVRGVAEYKYYIDRRNLSEWEVATDVHYVLSASDIVSLYPIGGLVFSRWTNDPRRAKIEGIDSSKLPKVSENRLGINIGFGGQVEFAYNTFVQVEAKEFVAKDYSQFVVSVGLMYQF